MAARKILIDTDPGVDDVLAMLLAFSALPEELEILLISVTYGNVDVQNCLRNIVSLFHHIKQEITWRAENGRGEAFKTLSKHKPIVAVGAEQPLADQMMMADFFHGRDGLGGIYESHPHLSPSETWEHLFSDVKKSKDPAEKALTTEIQHSDSYAMFQPSKLPAHEEILRLLRENEKDTITIVAIGPLTNLALAAAADTETFLRAKEIVVMGGTLNEPGNVTQPLPPTPHPNLRTRPPFHLIKQPATPLRASLNARNQITPVAEFNTYADSVAAARIYALTSPTPPTTMPPTPPAPPGTDPTSPPPPFLSPYPTPLSRQLNLTLFPLDITEPHTLTRGAFKAAVQPLLDAGSPLAEWTDAFLSSTFAKIESLTNGITGDEVSLALHDPLCVWYVLTRDDPKWKLQADGKEDIRVETSGQWTRGMCVVDRRNRRRREDDKVGERPGDTGDWLGARSGNRLGRCLRTPGEREFGGYLLRRVFGS